MSETTDATAASSGESTRTVLIAFGANLAVAVAKTVAALLTGSASMAASPHIRGPTQAIKDCWLLHGESTHQDYLVAYVVLAIAFALESVSLLQAVRQLRREAHRFDRDLLDHVLETSDPTTRAVFAEDAAALIGIVLATLGIGLHQVTGDAAWDAVGSISVGLLLGVIAVVLIDRNRRFIVGEPASPRLREAATARILQLPEVTAVRFIRLVFVGPKQLFLVASVDLEGDAAESHVASTLRRLENELQADAYIVDAVLTIAEPDELDRQL